MSEADDVEAALWWVANEDRIAEKLIHAEVEREFTNGVPWWMPKLRDNG